MKYFLLILCVTIPSSYLITFHRLQLFLLNKVLNNIYYYNIKLKPRQEMMILVTPHVNVFIKPITNFGLFVMNVVKTNASKNAAVTGQQKIQKIRNVKKIVPLVGI